MNEPFNALGTAGIGFFAMLVIGAIAGWIAEKATSSNHGLLTNILVGIAGSFVGTRLVQILGVYPTNWLLHIIVAAGGAMLLIFGWRAVTNSRTM